MVADHIVRFELTRNDNQDNLYRSEMAQILNDLEKWLRDRCENKRQNSLFMQDDYDVKITVD